MQHCYAQKPVNEKALHKEVKKLEKEGWETFPGALPLEVQITKSWQKQSDADERGNPVFINSDGIALAKLKSVAEAQAMEFARISIAGMIETKILSVIEANLSNTKLANDDVTSLNQIVRNSKNTITTKLGYVDPVVKLYRVNKDGDFEVHVTVFYNLKQTLDVAKNVIGKQVGDKLSGEQLDKLLTLN
ncbi:MAG: hypothetical protein WCO54_04660 [Bacteroidota bacterium]